MVDEPKLQDHGSMAGDVEEGRILEVTGNGRNNETHRGLKSRHIQLIAIGTQPLSYSRLIFLFIVMTGGTIGTGLFVGSGSILAAAGPGLCQDSFLI